MYLSERYLEMLQNTDVEEPKSSQHKNGNLFYCSVLILQTLVLNKGEQPGVEFRMLSLCCFLVQKMIS